MGGSAGRASRADVALKRTLKAVVVLGLAGGAALAGYEVLHWFTHVYEDEARVRGELIAISAQVNGRIAGIAVEEGARVAAGDLLVRLDDADIRLELAALGTDLALKAAERARLVSEKRAFEAELASGLRTRDRQIRAAELERDAARERAELSDANLERLRFLFEKRHLPEDRFNAERDKALDLRGRAALAEANVEVARRERERLGATAGRAEVIEREIAISDLERARIEDDIRLREEALGRRRIVSPIAGAIGRIHRYAGEYVEDGVPILTLHDPAKFWIEAYVDEGRLRHVRVGQPVSIDLETRPFEEFSGVVRRIGNATAAAMGVETPGSGSRFGGGVERVPVRISIDAPPPGLTPGMRARVNIRVHDGASLLR